MRLHSPEHLYELHKDDVKAARQLGGIAGVGGNAEPGAELSNRAKAILHSEDGDINAAAARAKTEVERGLGVYSRMNDDYLHRHIQQAKQDMVEAERQKTLET